MKIEIYKKFKKLLSVFLILIAFGPLSAQISTKIKDGTISNGAENASPGSIFELESNNKGMLTPRMTTAQRDLIAGANLTEGLLIFNTTSGCFEYWSTIRNIWMSVCGTLPPAVFEISTAQCSLIEPFGKYRQGTTLTTNNYLSIPVTVTQPGVYSVSATTTNGYYFGTSGTFPSAGTYTLNLPGTGTPNNGHDESSVTGDAVTIVLNGKTSSCIPKIFVNIAHVDYVINCGVINPLGNYNIGIPLTTSNKLTVSVSPSILGFWSMNTNTVNGYSFNGTGTFTTLDPNQTVELQGTGTPVASGSNSFNLVSNAATAASCSGIAVTVSPVSYTINCATAVPNGSYIQDVALNTTNTITLPINVTATGQTTITTNTANGISFTSGVVNLSTLGVHNVTLTGSGTPTATGSGTISLTVSGSSGGAADCTINVAIASQPVTYATNCTGITTSGNYAPGIIMTADNTMTVPVNVSYAGGYSISTNTVNGISFSGTGTFSTTGSQNIVLTASGTPAAGGTFSYAITTNSTNGSAACNKNITFVYRAMKILGLGGGVYQPGTATTSQSSRAILAATANFGPTGTVNVQNLTIINGGYNSGTTLKNLINTNNIDIIVIGYDYNPNAASILILNDFVKNKKGVLIHAQENDNSGTASLINTICGSSAAAVSDTGTTYLNPILNVSDPVLAGPFGSIAGLSAGSDVNNSSYVTGLPSNVTALATQNGNASRIFSFKHNTLGYFFIGDGGWTSGNATQTSTTIWPALMSSTGLPLSKSYYEGTTVYNSIMYANTMAWAIKYAQQNINASYLIP